MKDNPTLLMLMRSNASMKVVMSAPCACRDRLLHNGLQQYTASLTPPGYHSLNQLQVLAPSPAPRLTGLPFLAREVDGDRLNSCRLSHSLASRSAAFSAEKRSSSSVVGGEAWWISAVSVLRLSVEGIAHRGRAICTASLVGSESRSAQ